MRFVDYNIESEKAIMMLPGMATTVHTCFDKVIPYLEQYHLILCERDGHYDNSPSFVGIEKTCEHLPNMQIQVFTQMGHGQMLNECPEEYAHEILKALH